MKLENIRRKIDEIDLDLLALLEERMELGLRVRRFKTSATDPRREQTVLNRAMRSSLALVEPAFGPNRNTQHQIPLRGLDPVPICPASFAVFYRIQKDEDVASHYFGEIADPWKIVRLMNSNNHISLPCSFRNTVISIMAVGETGWLIRTLTIKTFLDEDSHDIIGPIPPTTGHMKDPLNPLFDQKSQGP